MKTFLTLTLILFAANAYAQASSEEIQRELAVQGCQSEERIAAKTIVDLQARVSDLQKQIADLRAKQAAPPKADKK